MSHSSANTSLLAALVRHYDELVDSVRRRFGDRHTAREVVHDVCVQLLEAPEKEGVRVPLALLRKIAARTVASLWDALGDLLDRFTARECANYLANAGYVPINRNPL